jgi:hypothetical protein
MKSREKRSLKILVWMDLKPKQKKKTTVKRGWYYTFWGKKIGNKRIKHSLFGRNN